MEIKAFKGFYMTYDTYVLILCLIVYTLMTALTIIVITTLTKNALKLIRFGAEDQDIIKENLKAQRKKRKASGKFEWLLSAFFCIVFSCVFGFCIYVNLAQDVYFENIPTLKVVNTNSMAKKLEKNEYLFENDLNNQFAALDLLLLYKLPDEMDLKLYDVVVYEIDEFLVVHRIVGIEEPNEKHPNERYFLLQGDAVENPDRFPVHYSQMRAIYSGQKLPFIGSFIIFMQSPAGWLCMILMLAATIATPIIDKILEKARAKRLAELLVKKQTNSAAPACAPACASACTPTFAPPVYLYPVYYDPTKVSCPAQPLAQGKQRGDKQ